MQSKVQTPTRLQGLLGEYRSVLWAMGGFSLAINLLMLTPTLYMLQVYDRVLSSRNGFTLLMVTLLIVALYVLCGLLEWVRSRVLIKASSAFETQLGPTVFQASMQRYLTLRKGNPASPLSDLSLLRQFLASRGLFVFFDAPWTPIYLLVAFLLSPWLGLFTLLSMVMLVGLAWLNERFTTEPMEQASRLSQLAAQDASSQLRNAEAIRAMGMLSTLMGRWRARQSAVLAHQAMGSEVAASISAWSRGLRVGAQSGVVGLGAALVLSDLLTPGAMMASALLLGRALSPLDMLIGSWRNILSARQAYQRLERLLEDHPPPIERISLPRPSGLVSADNLVVGAPGRDAAILKGITFGASAGMLVAVIGPSACGKSTLARALVGVWPAHSGTIRLDGADLSMWNQEELGQWVGYLPQDVELFDGTIAENISRFNPNASSEAILKASTRAGVHDMVLRMPEGYETRIGEDGTALSGGQRQRIALARALYGDPSLVVLDEPNAHLDEAGDKALRTALLSLKQDRCTVFVMTHRLNLLEIADALMILSEGHIKVYGPRDAVVASIPALARQIQRQSGLKIAQTGGEA